MLKNQCLYPIAGSPNLMPEVRSEATVVANPTETKAMHCGAAHRGAWVGGAARASRATVAAAAAVGPGAACRGPGGRGYKLGGDTSWEGGRRKGRIEDNAQKD